jgi:hypothetical protein
MTWETSGLTMASFAESIAGLMETEIVQKKTEKLRIQSHWILVGKQTAGLVLIDLRGRVAESTARV